MVREFCSRLIRGWKELGMFIGDTVARVALFAVFWLTVVPVHYIWELIKKDPMKRSFDKQQSSYFEDPDLLDSDHWKRMF